MEITESEVKYLQSYGLSRAFVKKIQKFADGVIFKVYTNSEERVGDTFEEVTKMIAKTGEMTLSGARNALLNAVRYIYMVGKCSSYVICDKISVKVQRICKERRCKI